MAEQNGRLQEVRDWLRKADHDLQAANELITKDEPLTDIICFHAQQAAKKSLKAFLVYHQTSAPKTHDLSALISTCSTIDDSFAQWHDAADILTPYAISTRYPDDFYEYPLEDAQEALNLAKQIKQFLFQKIDFN